ncbi:MAG TPA: hypothetical protein VGG68_15660 [Caulobacteraceae bacterium]|jgi:hypothetical protein
MNVVALQTPAREPPRSPLEQKAEEIKAALAEMERAEQREDKAWTGAMNARVAFGLILIEARDLLREEEPGTAFATWCEINVQRSMGDCYACIRLAESHDRLGPCTAPLIQQKIWDERIADERKRWREAKATSRAGSKSQSESEGDGHGDPVSHAVKIVIGMCRNMTVEERTQVKQALEEMNHA